MKKLAFLLIISHACLSGSAQFSIGTDFAEVRNISDGQKFWASGQTVQVNFHLSQKETFYGWLNYYGNGRFSNVFVANAKSSSVFPQIMPYNVVSHWRYHEFSVGWKHYLKGSYDDEKKISVYSIAGFGLITSKVNNVFDPKPNDTLYTTKTPLEGDGIFRKLSLDLGLGVEKPLGGNFFMYADVRTWIPTSDYPSPYMQNTGRIEPLTFSLGLRVLFSFIY